MDDFSDTSSVSGATPAAPLAFNGPIHRYLAISKQSRATFDAALEGGDTNAVALFAAECVFAELRQLTDAVERLAEATQEQAAEVRRRKF